MTDKEPRWTNEQAKLWEQTWNEPHMREGLTELKERFRVTGKPEVVGPGYDALVLAAFQFAHTQGLNGALLEIEKMKPVQEKKPLGKAFQAPTTE